MRMNNMACDWKTGTCGEAGDESTEWIDLGKPQKKVDLYYVTDPICSHCWALEPVLRRFEEQYGEFFRFHTVMGGLLESWEGFGDAKNGISQPADVELHWKEVGEHSRMPIDGSLWRLDPVLSSYPPSRVFKVIQIQDAALANEFLRRAREAVFAFNRNIGKDEILIELVEGLGLDGAAVVNEAEHGAGHSLLQEDFALARALGVRGFPTLIFLNEEKQGVKVVGARSLQQYIEALKQVRNETPTARPVPALKELLPREKLLFSKELEVMYDLESDAVRAFVEKELPAEAYTSDALLGEWFIRYEEPANESMG
ncbi:DsbA family protein [Gorillibacterium sp. CAU 1737]|uniref:DsbA family protein n=1 Tax=Gorillibacterium sp. CAU 1737 TaxID=3140362 RepID=UPI0032601606